MRVRSSCLALLFALLLTAPSKAQDAAGTRLLRFPDLAGDHVVFTYAGDLWLASDDGGRARRLTTHPGLELFAKFSPDGQWIAFTGQYDGDEQVYVMPASGGTPRQLTYYPARGPLPERWGHDNQVYGWTPDGSGILFRSMRDGWDLGDTKLHIVPVAGGLPETLPMPESGGGALSPDGRRIVYSPVTRDFRHWKRYQGGWAQNLYIFDLESHETRQITSHQRSERDPMWIGDRIYFSSDQDGVLNLYVYRPDGGIEQLTSSTAWDLRWPSADASTGRIVFEKQGQLQIFEIASGTARALSIEVPTDGLAKRGARIGVGDQISGDGLSPKGERAVFAARGDIFTVPIKHGRARNLTRSSGAHDRQPEWSPDGTWIAFVSDRTGEEEIYRIDQSGGPLEQLTDGSIGRRYQGLQWSPDARFIAYTDQSRTLYVLDVEDRKVTEIADDPATFGLEYEWSPNGGHIALSLADPTGLRSIHIWSRADGALRRVTDPIFNESSPTWDPAGDYLFYLSDREFRPQLSGFEFNYAINRSTQVYVLALREDVVHPFAPRSDEVAVEESAADESTADGAGADDADNDGSEADAATEDDAASPIKIDWEGLAGRVAQVPLDAGNYFGIGALEGHLLYVTGPAPYYGRAGEGEVSLGIFSIEDREGSVLMSGVGSISGSADGEKLLVGANGGYQLIKAAPGGAAGAKAVSVSQLAVDRVPEEEWAQIFDEVWRRFRDFFYDPNLHGYDWQALRARYRPLLAHVAHRSDLNYVISEMIGELAVGHAYISGGDYAIPRRPRAALLGARFALDDASGRYRIQEIFGGQNQEARYRSPLTEIGVGVDVGDYVLAINGVSLGRDDNPFEHLRHAGGAPVELLIGDSPNEDDARVVRVSGIRNEDDLIYLRWVLANRERVESSSDGRLGYLHIPDMGVAGISEFIKWFYGQVRKEGLVIDVRSNGGGNVSPMIIERLRRRPLMVDFERWSELPDTYPNVAFNGHLIGVIDEDTASDGDQFAYIFRQADLGPLIGKRTWGGVVGIYGRASLIDGGSVSVPEAGSADMNGDWVIEGYGVEPDIVVEQDPKAVIAGGDPQLEKAIEMLMHKIDDEPMTLPVRKPGPIKTQ